jgi:hypothetical protein
MKQSTVRCTTYFNNRLLLARDVRCCCRAWQAEKEAMRERRLAQEAARKEREEAAKAAAAAARAETYHKLMLERKAKYVSRLFAQQSASYTSAAAVVQHAALQLQRACAHQHI